MYLSVTLRHPAARETARYALLAIGLSWAAGVPAILGDRGGWLPKSLIGLGLVAFIVGPATAAVILVGRVAGRSGVLELVRTFGHWRFPARWWWVVPAAAAGAALTASAPVRHAGLPGPGGSAVAAALAGAPIVIAAAALEEIGWRGYLLPRLQRSVGPASASLLIGIPWGIWHLPLLLQPTGANADVPVWVYPAGALVGAFVYTALFNASNGSLLLVTAVHAARNLTSGVFLHDLPTAANPDIAYWSDLAFMLIAAATLFALHHHPVANEEDRVAVVVD